MAMVDSGRPSMASSSNATSATGSGGHGDGNANTDNNGAGVTQRQQAPTVVYHGSKMVRCRIDRNVPLDEILKSVIRTILTKLKPVHR